MAESLLPNDARRARLKVTIADKSPVVRSGLREFITRDGRFEVIDASRRARFYRRDRGRLRRYRHHRLVVPRYGADILAAIKRRHLATRIVVYTGEPGGECCARRSVSAAWGFISKSDEPAVLRRASQRVARGRMSLPSIDLQALTTDPFQELTSRERELLTALANGWTNLQIASRIGISRNTVKYHLKNLYDKLGVSNRAMAVALYMQTTMDQR